MKILNEDAAQQTSQSVQQCDNFLGYFSKSILNALDGQFHQKLVLSRPTKTKSCVLYIPCERIFSSLFQKLSRAIFVKAIHIFQLSSN